MQILSHFKSRTTFLHRLIFISAHIMTTKQQPPYGTFRETLKVLPVHRKTATCQRQRMQFLIKYTDHYIRCQLANQLQNTNKTKLNDSLLLRRSKDSGMKLNWHRFFYYHRTFFYCRYLFKRTREVTRPTFSNSTHVQTAFLQLHLIDVSCTLKQKMIVGAVDREF
jgi:hypothetical protein